MARRARVHSRDLTPQIAAPKGKFTAARVQRFDWPEQLPTTAVDEIGRTLHVGTTTETPQVTVTIEAFESSHNIFSYLTGYTPSTFPTSGASITDIKNIDVIGQVRDASTKNIVNSIYVKRGIVTGIDASFGVRTNSSVTYTVQSNSKKFLKDPVFYDSFTIVTESGVQTLAHTPAYLTRTSGYILDAYRTGTDGTTNYLDEGTDFTVTGANINFTGASTAAGDFVWVTYASNVTTETFQPLDDTAPAAIQGKYVPVTISLSSIPRVQTATIRAAFTAEEINEMGTVNPVGYEVGIPDVTGDITVLRTDNDLVNLLTGQATNTVETDLNYARTDLPLKIQLRDPRNPSRIVMTYYIPSITITQDSDTDQVNQSMNETFSWQSTTGQMYIASGVGPW